MLQAKKDRPFKPEVWGGIECTINRIAGEYLDQLAISGHYSRRSDIGEIAELGIRTLRYPVLWERQQPDLSEPIDWSWTDRQLYTIRDRGMSPIVGLLHHGSGPSFTSLDDTKFADLFAAYAGQVAARHPWVEYYTPVNEPLTTARFSGLYGIWYPHKKDPLCFLHMLLNQLKGVVLAMRAIRQVNPNAKLIQTEDLTRIHSTPKLAYQADFENERRWLTFDILCGKVDRTHRLWEYLISIGITEPQLTFFIDNPCIPDILGLNYYVTSERWLDENIEKYPPHTHGGNGQTVYADVEAIRIVKRLSLSALLKEVYARYELPVAITEVHLNCTREEQMRWLKYVWTASCEACREGVDIRAITSWALLGAYDWDSLLTKKDLHYESGAYLLKNGQLHLTAVGYFIRSLARKERFTHALLTDPGWWASVGDGGPSDHQEPVARQKLLVFGRTTDRTRLFLEICGNRGIGCKLLSPREKDLFLSGNAGDPYLYKPWGIIQFPEIENEYPSGLTPKLNDLEKLCLRQGIPYMILSGEQLESGAAVNHCLDLFIDQAIGAACSQPYPFGIPNFEELIIE